MLKCALLQHKPRVDVSALRFSYAA